MVFYFVLHFLLPLARAPHTAAVSIHRSVNSAVDIPIANVEVRWRQFKLRHSPYQGCLLNPSRMSYVLPYCQCLQCQLSNRIHLRRDTFIFHAATIVLTIETPSPLLLSSSLNFTFAYLGFNRAQSLLQRVYLLFHFQSILYHSNIGTHLLLPHFK